MTRVFGVVQSVFVGTLGLGAIIAPLLVELFDVRGALIVPGSLLPVLAIVFWRRLQAVDGDTLAPAELALLRSLPSSAAAACHPRPARLGPHRGLGDGRGRDHPPGRQRRPLLRDRQG